MRSTKRLRSAPLERWHGPVADRLGPLPEALDHGVDVEGLAHGPTVPSAPRAPAPGYGRPGDRMRRSLHLAGAQIWPATRIGSIDVKKGRHRRFEEARALKRTTETIVEPCPECGADPEDEHASWCLAGEDDDAVDELGADG